MNECFICYTIDGKSENELLYEEINEIKMFNYQLIKLSYAYNCNCISFAHNNCLKNINKCPMCRKYHKQPNFCAKTKYDKLFGWYFTIIKSYPKIYNKINHLLVLHIIVYLVITNITIEKNNKNELLFGFYIFFQMHIGLCFILKDFLQNYYLIE